MQEESTAADNWEERGGWRYWKADFFSGARSLAGAHRWSIPTPGARRSEHQRGVLCRCALSIIQRFLVEDSEQVQVSHSLARDDRLEVHVGKGKEVAL